MEKTPTLSQLNIKLGKTVSERLNTVAKIKNAMCTAIMLQVENNQCGAENEAFSIFQTIYLEANYLEDQLKKI